MNTSPHMNKGTRRVLGDIGHPVGVLVLIACCLSFP